MINDIFDRNHYTLISSFTAYNEEQEVFNGRKE